LSNLAAKTVTFMDEPRKFVIPEIVFGVGALDLVGRYARNLGGSRILMVTDPGVTEAGWPQKVQRALVSEGLNPIRFADVSPNPRAEEVMLGAERYAAEDCDVIVAVDGGSPMDCAKSIGIVSTNGRHVLEAPEDLKRRGQVMLAIRPGLPIILCTGFSEIITEDDVRHAGIRAFIMKPIIMKELAATIRRILDAED
jgi:alcohol dehydrogenase class IV